MASNAEAHRVLHHTPRDRHLGNISVACRTLNFRANVRRESLQGPLEHSRKASHQHRGKRVYHEQCGQHKTDSQQFVHANLPFVPALVSFPLPADPVHRAIRDHARSPYRRCRRAQVARRRRRARAIRRSHLRESRVQILRA